MIQKNIDNFYCLVYAEKYSANLRIHSSRVIVRMILKYYKEKKLCAVTLPVWDIWDSEKCYFNGII